MNPAGGVSHTPVSSVDFYPTILEIAGVRGTVLRPSDGLSLVPILRGSGSLERRALYWHYPHYSNAGSPPCAAIRDGDYKLIEFFEDGHVGLYNLAEDLRESHDLAAEIPEKAGDLLRKLRLWRDSINAALPKPNPDFEPAADR